MLHFLSFFEKNEYTVFTLYVSRTTFKPFCKKFITTKKNYIVKLQIANLTCTFIIFSSLYEIIKDQMKNIL